MDVAKGEQNGIFNLDLVCFRLQQSPYGVGDDVAGIVNCVAPLLLNGSSKTRVFTAYYSRSSVKWPSFSYLLSRREEVMT